MLFTALMFTLINFRQPVNRMDTTYELIPEVEGIEAFIIILIFIDLIMETIHRNNDYDHTFTEKYIYNQKYFWKFIFYVLFLIDFIYFNLYFPATALRFARILRPLCLLFYSSELRRDFKSIVYSFNEIIQLLVFFLGMTLFWAFFATRLIGQLSEDGEIEYDEYASNYGNLGTSFIIFWGLISFDTYPDAVYPAL